MIVVDPASPLPPFEQVRGQLADQIRGGSMTAGERLPSVRRLAADLGLAPNTVARAFRELEREGLVASRGRNGTVVVWIANEAEAELQRAATVFAARAAALGTDPGAARRLIERALGLDPV